MEPLTIFILVTTWMALAGAAVKLWRHSPTRACPLCETQVELGRAHCQACGYRFTSARYY
jgi:predicted amidophosphoribosyltransferase